MVNAVLLSPLCHLYSEAGWASSSSVQEYISNSSKEKMSLYTEAQGIILHLMSNSDSITIDLNILQDNMG